MITILVEAREGAFATKSAAVKRRDELLAKLKADVVHTTIHCTMHFNALHCTSLVRLR